MLSALTIPDAFSPAECAAILVLSAAAPAQDAGLVGGQLHNMRRAEIAWLDEAPGTDWVMQRIITLVAEANRSHFGFDLTEFAESPQVARYGAEVAGHFDWHADVGDGPVARKRKLTLVVQLSDPADYAGGALEWQIDAEVRTAPREVGTATLFPSFALHRVTPVTQGGRASLTTWAHGPAFR
ncbi:2OG-Fe(II) oxygenase [Anianabacter salinae]|uniref:2OG-Fe(II) oxygenase n=1 Tax=Anianabacter salinae TaxID=2851023 RepID=UPI00225E0CAB|nr:2OG-Fe(II) oxygenase [Anianabacter salinae]MBV0911324.1 2OG-Fe(II) oxygenase [Anianabacter salinae]